MASTKHHGIISPIGLHAMASEKSLWVQKTGRFGRLFTGQAPLFTNPNELIKLGAAGGPMDSEGNSLFTSGTPLGMIFLGQFIDHDITFDTTSSFERINVPEQIENARTANLDLDCIFGEGPEDEAFMYDNDQVSLRLLTGTDNVNHDQPTDLRAEDLARNGLGRAIIGDPRNDENRIISQLQLAFIRFYNAVYEDMRADGYSIEEAYVEARRSVTWHYQWIVVNEFLPLMVGKGIVDQIFGEGRKWFTPQHGPFIPIEFSVAAYRFGHSMISQLVQLRTDGDQAPILSNTNTLLGRGFTPITSMDQVVEWELFFDFGGPFQKAEKLDTRIATALLDLPFVTDPARKSLASRNLLRGQSFLLPSGEQIAKLLKRDSDEIERVQTRIQNLLSDTDIDLSAGTPLWFYILAEAAEIGRADNGTYLPGEGLGPVGGTIVAEVLIGLLELDPNSYLGSNRNWQPTLGQNGEFTMKDLILKSREEQIT